MSSRENYYGPQYSFGLEWAPELEGEILGSLDDQSCVEIIPENFLTGRYDQFLKELGHSGAPVAVHGVLLSIGSMEPLNESHLNKVLEIAERVNTVNFSEHLSLTSVENVSLDALTPLAWNEDVADEICRKVDKIQSRLKVPFLLENVSNRFVVPDSDYTETEFINRILKRTGCGLLLDVTNVYTNSINFDFDPYQWIDELMLGRTQLVHLAGGFVDPDGFLMDSHDNSVPEKAWSLFRYVCRKAPPFMTVIERTGNFPDFQTLLDEIDFARGVVLGEERRIAEAEL